MLTAWLLVFFILGCGSSSSAQTTITVKIDPDSAKWAPVAYLSLIQNFTNMNTISYEHIIEQSDLSETGEFEFNTNYLAKDVNLYRIHISKKGDPPASLIIGGKDHNHFFLFAKRDAEFIIESGSGSRLFNTMTAYGDNQNVALFELNSIVNILDSLDYLPSSVNREFIRDAVRNSLREYADTCSNPLVSLYAIYQTNFETDYLLHPDYYRKYLDKWKSEKSAYFKVFRKQLNIDGGLSWVTSVTVSSAMALIILVSLLYYWRRMKKNKNPLTELTIQERKVFSLLREGKTNKEIADECTVSLSTVKSHVSSIFSKLGVSSRKEIMDIEI